MTACAFDGCDRGAYCRGWCKKHYHRFLRHGDPAVALRARGPERPTVCKVDDCERSDNLRHGFCTMHYGRNRRTGKPEVRSRFGQPFWHHVLITETCWLWVGPTRPDGYGHTAGGSAHRQAYIRLMGPVPDGLHLDHLCRVRNCVNPTHLEPVTPAENNRRALPFRRPRIAA